MERWIVAEKIPKVFVFHVSVQGMKDSCSVLLAFIASLFAFTFDLVALVVGPVPVPAYPASGLPGDSVLGTVLALSECLAFSPDLFFAEPDVFFSLRVLAPGLIVCLPCLLSLLFTMVLAARCTDPL